MEYLKITLRSDLCAGNGESVGNSVDTDVCMDKAGLPYIPARRLKGCLKQAASELERMEYKDATGKKRRLFGDAYGNEGCLFLQDAVIKDVVALRKFLTEKIPHDDPEEKNDGKIPDIVKRMASASHIGRMFSTVRGQTRLENGVKVDNTLRFTRVISHYDPFTLEDGVEMEFEAPFYLYNEDPELRQYLEDCCRATRHIGTLRNRGLGNISITVCRKENSIEKERVKEEGERKNREVLGRMKPEERVGITFRIMLDAPVTLPGCDELNTSIQARSVIGCLAGNYLRKGSAKDKAFRSLFLNGDVCWSALTPVIGGVISDPVPMMLVKLKNGGNRLINHLSEENEAWKMLKPKTLDGAFASLHMSPDGKNVSWMTAEPSIHTSYHYAIHTTVQDETQSSGKMERILYTQDSIDAGMIYGGTVTCSAGMAGEVIRCLTEADLRFGRSRSAQYAACSMYGWPQIEADREERLQTEKGQKIYVILKSDLALQKDGYYVTDPETVRSILAQEIGISSEIPEGCQDYCRYHTVGGYQNMWQMQKMQVPVVKAGSVYCFRSSGECLPRLIRTGQFAQEGFGVCRIYTEGEMKMASRAEEGMIDRAEQENGEDRMHAVYVRLLAEAGLETVRKHALDYPYSDSRLPIGRLRTMLSQAQGYGDLLRMIRTMKESDVSSENEVSRKAVSENLMKELYGEGKNGSISWEKLLEQEPELWKEIQRYPEAEKILQKNWKIPLKILLHRQHYQKERQEIS